VERYAGGMPENEIAKIIMDHMNTKVAHNRWNILHSDSLPYVWTLLSAIDKYPRQAVGVHEFYKKNPTSIARNPLRKFQVRTAYVVPNSVVTFQADLTKWKTLLNVQRTGGYRKGKGSSPRENIKWNETLKQKNESNFILDLIIKKNYCSK